MRGATVTSGAAAIVTALNALLVIGLVLLLRRGGGPSLADAGLRREPGMGREILLGLVLGLVVFGFVLGAELLLGVARVQVGDLQPLGALYGLATFVFVALTEELAFRGFLLPVLARAGGVGVGLIGSSLLFGLAHVDNPAASPLAVVGLFTVGLLFAWGYLATGRLWLPMAFHLSWNVAEGPLFGFPVSGLGGETLLRVSAPEPAWLTGGAFGPEAGLLILPACALAAALIYAWRRATPEAMPPHIPRREGGAGGVRSPAGCR